MEPVVGNVMIIDDNEIDNFVTRRVLENVKFCEHINIITSGEEALDFFEANQNNKDKLPDLIFLDLNMPVVDGFMFLFEFDDFSEHIKSNCQIVILSGALEKKSVHKILKNEYVTDYINKPLTEETLKKLSILIA